MLMMSIIEPLICCDGATATEHEIIDVTVKKKKQSTLGKSHLEDGTYAVQANSPQSQRTPDISGSICGNCWNIQVQTVMSFLKQVENCIFLVDICRHFLLGFVLMWSQKS